MSSITATADQTYAAANILVDVREVRDSFTRTVSSGFGSASELGGAYTTDGGATSDYSVASGTGRHLNTSTNVSRKTLVGPAIATTDLLCSVTITGTATGASIQAGVIARYVDSSNYYRAVLIFNTDSTYQLSIIKRVAASETTIVTSASLGTYTPGTFYGVRLHVDVVTGVVRARSWVASTPQPNVWNVVATETPVAITTPGRTGQYSRLTTGNTNTNPVMQFDNFFVYDYQEAANLYRVTPDGVSTLVRNSPVSPLNGQILFWDDELPLSTAVYYLAVNASQSVSLYSGTVTITGSGGEIGWLKDPQWPAYDVRLDLAQREINCDAPASVAFTALSDETYANNTGVFSALNRARPNVTEMLRSDATLSLELLSRQQADILALKQIFGTGRRLLLQLPTSYGWAIDRYGSDYVTVDTLTQGRTSLDDLRHNLRNWVAPITLVDAPPSLRTNLAGGNGVGVGHATYAEMHAAGASGDAPAIDGTFETGVSGWTPTSGTFAQSTAQAHTGVASGIFTVSGSPAQALTRFGNTAVIVGRSYTLTLWALSLTGWGTFTIAIDWYTSGLAYISTSNLTSTILPLGVWTRYTFTATAPATAAFAQGGPTIGGTPTGQVFYLDDVLWTPAGLSYATLTATGRTYRELAQGLGY